MAINDGDQLTPGQKGWGGLGAHAIVFGKSPGQTALITLGGGGTGSAVLFLSGVNPGVNTFRFRANDLGTSIVNPASAKLTIDGEVVTLVASPKVLDATDFVYTRSTPFPAGNHTYSLEVKDTLNQSVIDSGTFISAGTPTITTALKAASVDTAKPGFIWRVFQNESAHDVTANLTVSAALAEAELALVGKLSDGSTGFLPNLADRNSQGPALAAGVLDGKLYKYEIPSYIYLNKSADGNRSNPQPPLLDPVVVADQMPGVPGTTGADNGIDAELTTFIELPAGVTRLGIACNNTFGIYGGYINDPARRTVIGEGIGSNPTLSPTIISVFAETAGVYPLRVVYQHLSDLQNPNAGSGWLTLYSIKANGDSVLVGDVANGGLKAYRAGVIPVPSTKFAINISRSNGQVEITWTEPGVVLEQSATLGAGWTPVNGAASPYKPTGTGAFYRLRK